MMRSPLPWGRHRPIVVRYDPANGEMITAHDGSVHILMTFFGADVIRQRSKIRAAVEQAAGTELDDKFLQGVIEAANAAVRTARPLGSNQGASIAIAWLDTLDNTQLRSIALGDCRVWIVKDDAPNSTKSQSNIYLGEFGSNVGRLLAPEIHTLDLTQSQYAVLAPAHYDRKQILSQKVDWTKYLFFAPAAFILSVAFIFTFFSIIVRDGDPTPTPTPTPTIVTDTPGTPELIPTMEPDTALTRTSDTPLPETGDPSTPTSGATETPNIDVRNAVTETISASKVATDQAIATSIAIGTASAQPTAMLSETLTPAPSETLALLPDVAASTSVSEVFSISVVLTKPEGDNLKGSVRFEWTGPTDLPPGILYELVFWDPASNDENPYRSPVGAKKGLAVEVDFDQTYTRGYLGEMLKPGKRLCWGVRLWNTNQPEEDDNMASQGCRAFIWEGPVTASEPHKTPGPPPTDPPAPGMTKTPVPQSTQSF